MVVTRETVRQKIVGKVRETLALMPAAPRLRCPGFPAVDISEDKSVYVNLDIVYIDGEDTGLGAMSDMRLMGTIVAEVCYKDGNTNDIQVSNNLLDTLQRALSSNDSMYPVRTYASRQSSPTNGASEGWRREALVTPFWYDTSRA